VLQGVLQGGTVCVLLVLQCCVAVCVAVCVAGCVAVCVLMSVAGCVAVYVVGCVTECVAEWCRVLQWSAGEIIIMMISHCDSVL